MADFGCCEFVYTRYLGLPRKPEKRIENSTNSAYSGKQSRIANRE